ncbi:acetate--CoA ligase family protein [Patescibacteria group bacterium]
MDRKLNNLFNPKSVAVVGATEKEGKIGNVILKNLLELGFSGEIFPVNPKHDEILGKKCYSSLVDIDSDVDLAIIAIPAKFVNRTIEETGDKVKNFVVISAGFSEIGEDGIAYEKELLKIADNKGLNILGPNCLGFINPKIKLNASFAGGLPVKGGVSLVSQSGALAVALMDVSEKENIEFSNVISVGNKMQLDESELIEYLGDDEDTKVIALYLEGIKNGEKFLEVAEKVSAKKPVIILKAGKSEKAQKAIASHTGALAGSDDIMTVAFDKAGVMRADNLEEFFDLIKIISNFEYSGGKNTAIITNAGGPGVLATDSFKDKVIDLLDVSETGKESMREFLPHESSVENPVDLLGDADETRYEKALEVLDGEDVENIFCIMTAQDQTPVEKIAQVIVDFNKKSSKNAIPVFVGGQKMEKALVILKENGIPNFEFPQKATNSLNKYCIWRNRKESEGAVVDIHDFMDTDRKQKVSEIISHAKEEKRGALLFGEAADVMNMYAVDAVNFINLKPEDELESPLSISFPVAVKVDSDKVLHKTDKQGLILGVKDDEELKGAVEIIRGNFSGENVIIQTMIDNESELILGMKNDSVFGPVIVYGLGGIYTEVFKMIDFIILPSSKDEIRESVKNSKIAFLFEETRGKKVGELEDIVSVLFNFSLFVQECKNVEEVDINPLLISKDGKLVAVDVKIIL